ncbi:hypothetical protein CH276_28045 [Rhodococcus sp. 06-470-2]|uniref:hypothetical protein n=1 Tax=unclassified Rhodococcus (in: high G+C Gram-positive bacteria) TaxID=192944 RepID=UPI000B9ADE13|nr:MULTISPECIES: hypothetical protein [unclassified Rhodococcus (in: high G+C Gram-positive bacteria)]OZC55961.1 hypothetical protein CH276_28045 [Rhodococcus sp. 06-470-2]OZE64841.1 hypothetical protein CH265_10365 [Rhodococcus sp. 05-2221-1B]
MSDSADVRSIASKGTVRQYGTDARAAKDPFAFALPGSPEFSVPEPDAGTVMDIEEAKTSRQVLKLFLGDDYPNLVEYLEPLHPDVLVDLAQDISRHFGLFDTDAAGNRADRRRRDRHRR